MSPVDPVAVVVMILWVLVFGFMAGALAFALVIHMPYRRWAQREIRSARSRTR